MSKIKIGIYSITNQLDNKRYIGKSKNINLRFAQHRYFLKLDNRNKDTNRYLYNSIKKYGIANFKFEIIEEFDTVDEKIIAERELYWMEYYNTCNKDYGYNLRKDSSTGMIVHNDTKLLQKINSLGKNNPNFNNKWSDEQKEKMSIIKKSQFKDSNSNYNQNWKNKISIKSSELWANNPDIKEQMSKNVSKTNSKYYIYQYNKSGELIKKWDSLYDILKENPNYKRHNIYSVCSGAKPSIYGYKWIKELKI